MVGMTLYGYWSWVVSDDTVIQFLLDCLSWELCLWSPKLPCKKYTNIKSAILKKPDEESTWGERDVWRFPAVPALMAESCQIECHTCKWVSFQLTSAPAFQLPKLTLSIGKCVTPLGFAQIVDMWAKIKFLFLF